MGLEAFNGDDEKQDHFSSAITVVAGIRMCRLRTHGQLHPVALGMSKNVSPRPGGGGSGFHWSIHNELLMVMVITSTAI